MSDIETQTASSTSRRVVKALLAVGIIAALSCAVKALCHREDATEAPRAEYAPVPPSEGKKAQ